ncbi:glyceraldehyde-3-phosphate dehydrogenase [Dioszegia hungarica]|uniref:Glyceraldehyde-3-phosphate dehydrogenase n=1 Tax=Dioszegia hungarica TaxID=4972 RepID=A0AA38HG63_9TREE|nr:glyceraldehyde-3-phosphate dehydrogenase [Dioszegia hungarica]KAI9639832.1 glyceraldehyde-3-phosphate dehydrogenase [Dioszegia hungarica]
MNFPSSPTPHSPFLPRTVGRHRSEQSRCGEGGGMDVPIAVSPSTPIPAVGINGFGRIGRAVFRLALTRPDLEIRAVNHTAHSIEHLLTAILYDSTHGPCPEARNLLPCPPDHPGLLPSTPNNPKPSGFLYKGRVIHLFSQRDASKVDWASAGVEYVMESTGKMLTRESAGVHIKAGGAKKVIISAPSKDCLNVVYGVNHSALYLKANMGMEDIISNASCTTNCLAPIAMVLHRSFGIETGMMTTVHASTSSQKVLDGFSSKDMRSGRSAMGNIIPASTGAAQAVVKVLPELAGKFHGISIRVPVTNVSLVDLTVTLSTPVSSKEELLLPFRRAAALPPSLFSGQARLQTPSVPPLAGVLGISDEQLVSSDFLGSTYSSVIDVDACCILNPTTVKIVSWYDNEYGFSTRMCDLVVYMNRYEYEHRAEREESP